jgi:hypothetical protein
MCRSALAVAVQNVAPERRADYGEHAHIGTYALVALDALNAGSGAR